MKKVVLSVVCVLGLIFLMGQISYSAERVVISTDKAPKAIIFFLSSSDIPFMHPSIILLNIASISNLLRFVVNCSWFSLPEPFIDHPDT